MNQANQKSFFSFKNAGFTLIELLVVVLIIGILSAVALPQYHAAVVKSKVARALPVLRSIRQAQEVFRLSTGASTVEIDDLDILLPYTTRTVLAEERIKYEGSVIGGSFVLVPNAIFWDMGEGFTIDYYGDTRTHGEESYNGICYPSQPGGLPEKVCASLGKKTSRISNAGTNVYALSF